MPDGRILILDDELPVAQTIGLIAESSGLKSIVTQDANTFFQQLDKYPVDYIVLDLVMPAMDGVQVMRQLAEQECNAQIIVISGMESRVLSATERSAMEHGLDVIGTLTKPFSAQQFRQLIDAARNDPHPRIPKQALDSDLEEVLSETGLLKALAAREFVVVYQPKVTCDSGKLAEFEALARWHHPEKGLIMPDQFIPLAENLGLMDELTNLLVGQALSWFARNSATINNGKTHSLPLSLSVNISAKNLHDIHFADKLLQMCKSERVAPSQLMLELTETSAMTDPTLSLDLLTRLRVKGFQLSLDDFGTGYSSMAQLVRLPFTEIKVDRSFVMTAMKSPESRTAVRSIIELGQNLGLSTTAEGLEDQETLQLLRQLGCDFVQGHLISHPLQGHEILHWADHYRAFATPG